MVLDPVTVGLYIELGGKLARVGIGTYQAIKAALQADPNIELDNQMLAEIDREYASRIAKAKAEAGL